MRQYVEQKAEVGDAVLLFRMGDFYETFYEDAKTISRVLGLTLTARNKGSETPIPLAGVPYHAVDGYIAKLVRAGFKVAVSEQVEDPKLAKGIVKRQVDRVITPGTLTDASLLDERRDNYLVGLCPDRTRGRTEDRVGLACVELASGRFFAQVLPAAALIDELARLAPAELLVPEGEWRIGNGEGGRMKDDGEGMKDRGGASEGSSSLPPASPFPAGLREALGAALSPRPDRVFDPRMAEHALCSHFGVTSLAGLGFDTFDASLCAAAAVLDYLKETQKSALDHILKIVPRRSEEWVLIDPATLRSLEVERTLRDAGRRDHGFPLPRPPLRTTPGDAPMLPAPGLDRRASSNDRRDGSLLGAVDMTAGPMGARLLRRWLLFPLRRADEIRTRQEAIAFLRDRPDCLRRLREHLGEMGDVERILARLGVGRVSPRDMVALGRALRRCGQLHKTVKEAAGGGWLRNEADRPVEKGTESGDSSFVLESSSLPACLVEAMRGHDELVEFLRSALNEEAPPIVRDGGFIADGYNAELDRLRNVGQAGHRWLAEYQAREARRTRIGSLKIGYNSVFGYYIEITHQHRDKVPTDYVRKQTVRNAERYVTDELKRHESEVLGAAEQAKRLELELFEEIRGRAAADLPRLRETAEAVATLDVLAGLAELSRRRDYCRPELVDGGASGLLLDIVDGRHPVLDVTMAERFVPNDCRLSADGNRVLVITGPNMAGKSTYIRQVALLVLLAQTGSYVPAKSMRWAPVDRIYARVGASDEIARGRSTFMVEMVETARILNNATSASLVILDEIGRGTSTYDGLALAWAITEFIAQRVGCRTLFATHYHELTELAEQLGGVANFNVAVREELRPKGAGRDVVFLHKIVPGATDRSYGVHVAAMAGLPASVLRRSETILAELEGSFAGKSRRTALSGGRREDPGPLLPFTDAQPMPDWWRELVDAIDGVQIDRTTPLDALTVLQRLQAMVRKGS